MPKSARARSSDPLTSHLAAAQVTPLRQTQLSIMCWRIVREFPGHNLRWYVNKSIEQTGKDAGWYGTLGTAFSRAEDAGYIRVSGFMISEFTGCEVQTYEAVEETQVTALVEAREQAVRQRRSDKKAAHLEEKREKERKRRDYLERGNDSGEYGV